MSKVPKYNEDLAAPVQTQVSEAPKVKVHRVEWRKVGGVHWSWDDLHCC
jgi:hypothetical protein